MAGLSRGTSVSLLLLGVLTAALLAHVLVPRHRRRRRSRRSATGSAPVNSTLFNGAPPPPQPPPLSQAPAQPAGRPSAVGAGAAPAPAHPAGRPSSVGAGAAPAQPPGAPPMCVGEQPLADPALAPLAPPATSGVCNKKPTWNTYGAIGMGWSEENSSHVCSTRRGAAVESLPWLVGGIHEYPNPEWWMECLPVRSVPPPFAMPAAVAALRAGPEAERCPRGGGGVNATLMLRSLAGAAPKNPSVLVLVVSDRSLAEVAAKGGIGMFSALAVAATALYAVAHGYRMVFYDGQQACSQPPPSAVPYGVPPKAQCGSGAGKANCCFEGGWWLSLNWLKPAAILDAIGRYPEAQWMLSLDTDATPTHLAYPLETVTSWAAHSRLAQRCPPGKQGTGIGRCHAFPGRAPPTAPSDVRTVLARDVIMDPGVEQGKGGFDQVNTGALLLRLADPDVRSMISDWWDTRNSLCRPGVPPVHPTIRHGRAFASGDQTGFSVWVLPNHTERIHEVQHFMQGHGGLFYTHLYSKKSWTTVARFAETVGRHAAGLAALLCGPAAGNCSEPRRLAAGELREECAANAHGGVSLWVQRWYRAALSPAAGIVHEHRLQWPQGAVMSRDCFQKHNMLNAMVNPRRKGRTVRRR
eukprot:TRINITY_DN27492_c0_g4_i1.p1 TRINITY_DN27492_c0_g4~~TRINITY_DN27492_c0_g4_i1.p1  ORF type:complete len:637 (+),score=125.50 TRINITY_DN27492_c0_g4_i1:100-2010(+)